MQTTKARKTSHQLSTATFLLLCTLQCIALRRISAQENAPDRGLSAAFSDASSPGTPGTAADRRLALQKNLKEHPQDARAWYELGILDGQDQNLLVAEQDLRRSIAIDATQPEAHYLLGLSLVVNPRNKLDWPQAIAEFRTALKLRPSYAAAYTYLGAGLSATGHNQEAIEALESAVRLAPQSASSQFNFALVLDAAGRNTDAAAAYRAAIACRQKFAEAHSALGKLLLRMGDQVAADQELRQAIAADPDLEDAHYALGRLLRAQQKTAAATNEFEIARTLGQREADGVASSQKSNAAMRLAAAGDFEGATKLLREAIPLRPEYAVPHYNLGLILADRGQWDLADSQFAQAASLMPAKAGPWLQLGRALRRQGRNAQAVECLRWAARLDPNEKVLQELYAASNDAASFSNALRPAYGVKGESPEDFEAYGAALTTQGDLQGAIGMFLHALSLSPTSEKPRLSLAQAYHDTGDHDRALQEYRKVLVQDPANKVANSALAH